MTASMCEADTGGTSDLRIIARLEMALQTRLWGSEHRNPPKHLL